MPDRPCPQAPVDPSVDLRDMVRRHVVRRSLACMDAAARRRRRALADGLIDDYVRTADAPTRLFRPLNATRQPLSATGTASFLSTCGQHATACDQLDGEGKQNLLAWLDTLKQKPADRS